MRPDQLDVVTVYANPLRWESRLKLYREFETEMLAAGVRLTVVECAYGDRPFEIEAKPGLNVVQVRSKTLVWNKECLINIGISRLPHDWKYVAWIDADVSFRKACWATETIHALQQYYIVQPWDVAYDLGPHDEHMAAHKSFLSQWWAGKPVCADGKGFWSFEGGPYDYPHSGYAWAATRQAIDWLGGLFAVAAAGAGDHHMALALVGKAERSLPGGISASYHRHLIAWQDRAVRLINGNLGFVQGTIEHSFHGRKVDRKYVDRWAMLLEHGFDPDTDLKTNSWGVFELAGNKPGLTLDMDRYFRARNEDINSL
jgi:hypothetical protein